MRTSSHQAQTTARPVSQPVSGLPVVSACPEIHPEREKLEQYISSIFQASYGARILEYLPLLIRAGTVESPLAALGLRGAAHGTLFCERYISTRIEEEVLSVYGVEASRDNLMELGNLVSTQPGQAVLLYMIVTGALYKAGVSHLIFTANLAVQKSISRSGFTPVALCEADPDRLGDYTGDWGTYYEGSPLVMLADIALTMRQARSQEKLSALLDCYADDIDELAEAIRAAL